MTHLTSRNLYSLDGQPYSALCSLRDDPSSKAAT